MRITKTKKLTTLILIMMIALFSGLIAFAQERSWDDKKTETENIPWEKSLDK